MRRQFVLGTIVAVGVVAATALSAQQPAAQGGRGREGRGGGFGAVGAAQKVAENLYMIPGAGGNTAAYVTANGVVLVDTKLANNGQAILDQVKAVSDKPITHIINTHSHPDHNGSNQFFPATVEVVAHENSAKRMETQFQGADMHGRADRTVRDRLTLLGGRDQIDLYHFGAAHTNGDVFVVFRTARVVHTGDAFANKGAPFIDVASGGSGVAYPDTLAKAHQGIQNVDTIITGHAATTMTWQDLGDFAEFNRLFLEHARASMKAGKAAEQAMADLKLPEKFKDYGTGAGGRGGAAGNFGVLYEELKTQK